MNRPLGSDLHSLGGGLGGQGVADGLLQLAAGDGARGHGEVQRVVHNGHLRGAVGAACRTCKLPWDDGVHFEVHAEGGALLQVVAQLARHGARDGLSPVELAVIAAVFVSGGTPFSELHTKNRRES